MTRRTTMLAITALLGSLMVAGPADARKRGWGGGGWGGGRGGGGHGWGGHGWGHGRGGGPMKCGHMLLHAHPEMLKEKLGLKDAQIARIASIRSNFLHKQIDLRAKVDKHHLQLRQLMQKDLPPQNKVLQVMRKKRAVRGVMAEERVKAYLKILAVLDAGQRKKVREKCLRHGWGKGRRGGRGWRRGGGGPGWGPPAPPPPPPAP